MKGGIQFSIVREGIKTIQEHPDNYYDVIGNVSALNDFGNIDLEIALAIFMMLVRAMELF